MFAWQECWHCDRGDPGSGRTDQRSGPARKAGIQGAFCRHIPATKLIATHDLELAVELCSRAIVLDHGEVVADGPTTELLNDEPLMLAHGLERPHILWHNHPH